MDIKEVVSVWVLGVLSQSLTNDKSAITLTRQEFLTFGIRLNQIANQLTNQHRNEIDDFRGLQELKELLQRLECAYADVFIGIPQLTLLIRQIWDAIRKYEESIDDERRRNRGILINLKLLWLWSETGAVPTEEIKKILYGGFFKRSCYRIEYSLRQSLKWVCRRVCFVWNYKR